MYNAENLDDKKEALDLPPTINSSESHTAVKNQLFAANRKEAFEFREELFMISFAELTSSRSEIKGSWTL